MKPSFIGRLNQIVAWVILLIIVIPSLVAFPVSITNKTYLSFSWDGASFQHFHNLFTSSEWISSFRQSLVIAVVSSVLATSIGTLAAIGLWRLSGRIIEFIRAFLLLPLMVPPHNFCNGIL